MHFPQKKGKINQFSLIERVLFSFMRGRNEEFLSRGIKTLDEEFISYGNDPLNGQLRTVMPLWILSTGCTVPACVLALLYPDKE